MADKALVQAVKEFHDTHDRLNPRSKIWWIASFPKSGNTWVRVFLSSYMRGGGVSINTNITRNDLDPYFWQAVSPIPIDQLQLHEATMIRPAVLFHLATMFNSPFAPLLVKTHSLYDRARYNIPPCLTYGAIYLVRDPRDVAISWAKHVGKPLDEVISHMNNPTCALSPDNGPLHHMASSWSEHVSSWTDVEYVRSPVLVLQYEKMISNPEAAFRSILDFLSIEMNEKVFAATLAATTIDELRKLEDAETFIEKKHGDRFFNKGIAGGWKDVLTNKQREQIEADHGDVMKQFGYL